jgi:hypothetical protein
MNFGANNPNRISGLILAAIAIAAMAAFVLIAFHTHRDGLNHPDCAICVAISSQAFSPGFVPAFFAILALCCIIPLESGLLRIPDSPILVKLSRAPPFCC